MVFLKLDPKNYQQGEEEDSPGKHRRERHGCSILQTVRCETGAKKCQIF